MSVKTYTGNEGIREQSDNKLFVGLLVRRSLRQATISVGASATPIPVSPLAYRRTVIIMNISANVIYLGNSSVTTVDGFPIYPRAVVRIDIEDDVTIYGIAGGASEIRILEGA